MTNGLYGYYDLKNKYVAYIRGVLLMEYDIIYDVDPASEYPDTYTNDNMSDEQ